jgi:hypothetical protein
VERGSLRSASRVGLRQVGNTRTGFDVEHLGMCMVSVGMSLREERCEEDCPNKLGQLQMLCAQVLIERVSRKYPWCRSNPNVAHCQQCCCEKQ